jgi:hypothetical protein
MPYSMQERAEIVELYFSNACSPIKTQRKWKALHGRFAIPPTRQTINRLVDNFLQFGTVIDRLRSGRPSQSNNL